MKKTIQFLVAMATLSGGLANANLVAHYTFDETSGTTAADSSPSGANGVISANVTLGAPGKFGTAFTFNNNTNSFVDMGNATTVFSALNTSQQVTVSVWVKFAVGTDTRDCFVFLGEDTAASRYIDLATTPATGQVGGRTRNTNTTADPHASLVRGTNLNDGAWHHVAYTSNAATDVTQIFVNGVMLGTTTTPAFTFPAFNNFEVGRLGRSSPADAFSGSVDELRVYDKVLSVGEIAALAGLTVDPAATVDQTAVDFGAFVTSPAAQTRTVKIKNEGVSQTLVVDNVEVYGNPAFTTNQALPVNIAPGATADLTVTFDPAGADGYFNGTMEIYSNAVNQAIYTLPLDAEVKVATPSANLVSHFTFEDVTNVGKDFGSYQNDGTAIGDAQRTTSARVGSGALRLDGTGDYIDLGLSSGMDYTGTLTQDGNGFTVACWALVPTTSTLDRVRFFSVYENNGPAAKVGWGVGRRNTSRALSATTFDRADYLAANNSAPVAGDWNHYAYVFRNFRNTAVNRVEFYVNGVRVSTVNAAVIGVVDSANFGFAIGALGRTGAFEGFEGSLDDLRIYSRALTAANITDIYNVAPSGSTYSTWAASFGLDPATTGLYGEDPDGDGLSNSLEYFLGTSPVSGVSGNRPVASRSGNNITVVYRRKLEATTAGFQDQVQYSETLAENSWTNAQHNVGGVTIATAAVDAATEEVTVTIPTSGAKKFARLKVVAP